MSKSSHCEVSERITRSPSCSPLTISTVVTEVRPSSTGTRVAVPVAPPDPQRGPAAVFQLSFAGCPPAAQTAAWAAADGWSKAVTSTQPIVVQVTCQQLPANVLGGAMPAFYVNNFSSAGANPPVDNGYYYPIALANKLAMADFAPNMPVLIRHRANLRCKKAMASALFHFPTCAASRFRCAPAAKFTSVC